jgi:hypothetical protein
MPSGTLPLPLVVGMKELVHSEEKALACRVLLGGKQWLRWMIMLDPSKSSLQNE